MSTPASSFPDGSDDTQETFSEQKHVATVQRLMASLDAACAALSELDSGVKRQLRENPLYTEMVNQLVAPLSASTRFPIPLPNLPQKNDLPVKALSPEDPPLEVSLIRQLKLVEMCLDQKRHPADLEEKPYIVAVSWWNWWVRICDTSLGARDAGVRYTMGPVDNSNLVDLSTGSIRSGLTPALNQGIKTVSTGDFVYVPRTVWESCFEHW